MIKRWKAQLRAWLIDLVRDAVRLESYQQRGNIGLHVEAVESPIWTAERIKQSEPALKAKAKPAPIRTPIPDPSFEQMQAEAIQAQEKYYEPAQ